MPNRFRDTRLDLQEVTTRNETARLIVARLSDSYPTLVGHWHIIDLALADTVALAAALARTRLDHANLLASARAALSAHDDGEADPLSYLRDELREHRWGR